MRQWVDIFVTYALESRLGVQVPSMSSPDTKIFSSVGNGLGSKYTGMAVSSMIYGISVLQTYTYFTEHSSRDSNFLKTFVAFVFTIDSIQVAFTIYTMYNYSVQHFGDMSYLQEMIWSTLISDLLGMVIVLLLDCSFAFRIYLLNGRKPVLPIIICTLSTAFFVCGTTYTIYAFQIEFNDLIYSVIRWAIGAACTCITSQFLISGSLACLLRSRKTSFSKTTKDINRIINFVVRTTILGTTLIVVMTIAYLLTKNPSIYAAMFWIGVQVYLCSFLSMLNSRMSVKLDRGIESQASTHRHAAKDFVSMSHLRGNSATSKKRSSELSELESQNLYAKPPVPPKDTYLSHSPGGIQVVDLGVIRVGNASAS